MTKVTSVLRLHYKVVYTRTSDSVSWSNDNTEDLQTRCDLANKKNADLFVSIHLNSSVYEANGYEIYCDFNNKNTVKLSNSILKQLDQLDYSTNSGSIVFASGKWKKDFSCWSHRNSFCRRTYDQ